MRRLPIDTELDGYQWTLRFKMAFDPGTYTNGELYSSGKCNIDVPLPNWNQGGAPAGQMGTDARMRQVVWDELLPPA